MLIIKSNTIITFLSITNILFIFLFSIIDNNDILITIQSSIENTTQTTTNNSSNQSDPTSNSSTAIQWKKFVNETIGISLEYPSNLEEKQGTNTDYFHLAPKLPAFTYGTFLWGREFEDLEFFRTDNFSYNNLDVMTRLLAADILDHSEENTEYEIIEKPNMEKYTIDGEKASAFSYREIHPFMESEIIFNVEKINLIRDGKFITFKFSYAPREIDEKKITGIKDHMFKSIKWLNKEKNDENIDLLDEQSGSTNEKINQLSKYNNESKLGIWKKFEFVNETIGISLEYPSNWEKKGDHKFEPNYDEYPFGERPFGTHFQFEDNGKPLYNNLDVMTRINIMSKIDSSYEFLEYEIIEKPNMEKYTIDGEKVSAFSYKQIMHGAGGFDIIDNIEEINIIKNGKFIIFKFSYPPNKFDEEYITGIKDHMFNSIRWLNSTQLDGR